MNRIVLALLVAVVAVVALPARAAAQTHPCDATAPPQATIQSATAHKMQFCAKQSDHVETMLALLDGATAFDMLPVTAKTAASATGYILYESNTSFLTVPKGNHTVSVALYNRDAVTGLMQIGAASSPLAFVAADDTPPPAAPLNIRIVR